MNAWYSMRSRKRSARGVDMKLYVIYDILAEECGPVYEAKNDDIAVRMYKRLWEKEPAGRSNEFWLFCVGEIDRKNMEINAVKATRIELNVSEVDK
nr:MAG: hypothetical protein [Microviridae sp.]